MQNDLIAQTGDKVRINLHPGQQRAYDSKARFVLVLAGTQGGKTSFGPIWLDREIRSFKDGGDFLAVSASYDLFQLKMLPEMLNWFVYMRNEYQYNKSTRVLWRKDEKARIILRSAASEGGLESNTAKAAWCDEPGQEGFGIGAWEAILRRLSLAQGRALLTTTPYYLDWLYTEFYQRWLEGNPNYDVINFRSIDNPSFPLAEYERAMRELPDWKFQMFYNGIFTKPANLVYDCWDYKSMVMEPQRIPCHWYRYVGVDFGGANTCVVYLAQSPKTGIFYVYHSMMLGEMTTREMATDALYHLGFGATDFTAWGGAKSEGQFRRDWSEAGFAIAEPFISGVEEGIDRTYSMLKTGKLKIFKSNRQMIDQFSMYSRKLDERGNVTNEIDQKAKYHYLDSLRYVASTLETYYNPKKESRKEEVPDDTRKKGSVRARMEFFGEKSPEERMIEGYTF